MIFRPPSKKQLIILFLTLGPLLWPFGMYAAPRGAPLPPPFLPFADHGFLYIIGTIVFSVIYGFASWWTFALFPSGWLLTWIPTVLTALACERALYLVCGKYRVHFNARITLIGSCGVTFGLLSALIFGILSPLSVPSQELVQVATLGGWMLTIGITGAILGVIVGAGHFARVRSIREFPAACFGKLARLPN